MDTVRMRTTGDLGRLFSTPPPDKTVSSSFSFNSSPQLLSLSPLITFPMDRSWSSSNPSISCPHQLIYRIPPNFASPVLSSPVTFESIVLPTVVPQSEHSLKHSFYPLEPLCPTTAADSNTLNISGNDVRTNFFVSTDPNLTSLPLNYELSPNSNLPIHQILLENSNRHPKPSSSSFAHQLVKDPSENHCIQPTNTVVHRPRPIRPSSRLQLSHIRPTLAAIFSENHDTPLDLSQHGCRQSVADTESPQSPHQHQQQQQSHNFMPVCNNSNLNSNWIAIKFGAASGPNRMSYPREFKLMVINYYYTNGENKYRTCKEFQITKSMLNGWLQKIEKIRQSRPGSLKSGRSGRKPQFPTIEKQLFSLYTAHLGTGRKVGNRWIRETARNLAQQQCSKQELAGMCQFSERWLSNFKKRYHINLNRDWSCGSNVQGCSDVTTASAPSTGDPSSSPTLSISVVDHTPPNSECGIDVRESGCSSSCNDTDVDAADMSDVERSLSLSLNQEQIQELLTKPGQLPIQAFYERFPWLYRKNSTTGEPGKRGRKVQFPDVEKVLFERLKSRQAGGERISNRWLQSQARQLASQLCPGVLEEATKSARCLFSEHWLHNFKKRYGVSLKMQSTSRKIASDGTVSINSDRVTNAKTTKCTTFCSDMKDPADHSNLKAVAGSEGIVKSSSNLDVVTELQNWFMNQYRVSADLATVN
ncbi:hypothetical protein AB6A40_003085 [Gnathostoma spinigerum]|uniref:HTH CENPB-type domain-containing protein n=1 Tax=Gnathostoma spinigerum TaxID=75299 RepID=A0ABD6EG54_9BILA